MKMETRWAAIALAAILARQFRRAGARPLAMLLLFVPVVLLALPRLSTVRPQIFSTLFFALLLNFKNRLEIKENDCPYPPGLDLIMSASNLRISSRHG